MSLAEKIRESRKVTVKVGKITFYFTRPTEEQLWKMISNRVSDPELLRQTIIGMDGAKESDLFKGGSNDPIAFNKEDFDEAIGDLPELFEPLSKELIEKTKAYRDKGKDLEKNS
jgi:hypothetical protein